MTDETPVDTHSTADILLLVEMVYHTSTANTEKANEETADTVFDATSTH